MDEQRLDLTSVTMSTVDGPARVVVHGAGGTGKTTLACYFPKPIIIGAETGIPRDLGFAVPCVRPRSWVQMFDVLASLTGDRHEHETAVIDTLDWVEPFLHEFVCARDSGRETEMNKKGKPLISIEDYGFGRGFLAAEEEFVRLLSAIDVLQHRRRMHVVILMHTIVRTMKNPMGPDYDRYEPKCQARVSAKAMEWAENVVFLHFRRDAAKISEDKERQKENAKAKGIEGIGQRLVGLQDSALFDAKNRVRLPAIIPMPINPNELVTQLLGEHLHGGVEALADRQQRAPQTITPTQHFGDGPTIGNDPAGAARFVQSMAPAVDRFRTEMQSQSRPPVEPEPPRSADYRQPTSSMAMPREGYGNGPPPNVDRRHLEIVPPVPAHHESRKDDEQSRQDDAFARARGSVEQRDARRNEEPKTRGPAPHPNAPAGATSNGAQQDDLIKRLTAAISAGNTLGAQYRADMQLWQDRAVDDAKSSRRDKLEAIIKRINKNVDEYNSKPKAR